MKVLVTGGLGWTATSIVKALDKGGLEPVAFDLPSVMPPGLDTIYSELGVIRGDITKFGDVLQATRDVSAIVHLAVATGEGDQTTTDLPFMVNVKGTWNIFESARRNGIDSIVLMSSAPVHLPPPPEGKILGAESDWRSDPGKDHLYDLTKRLQETIARDFCETFDMRAVALRAGHIVDGVKEVDAEGRPLAEVEYCRGGWVCRTDLARAVLKALAYDKPGFSVFHVIGSIDAWRHYDLERAERLLGAKCKKRFENYALEDEDTL